MLYPIAITLLPGIGAITAKKLIAYCGNAENVFHQKKESLLKIPGIGEILANTVSRNNVLLKAEKELDFIDKAGIRALYYEEPAYPERLKQCIDSPIVLFVKGNVKLNSTYAVAVVGTRNATNYGKHACQELISQLKSLNVLIISGLAYGIDTIAHKTALEQGLPTLGVLAHGLDRIYPPPNAGMAEKMLQSGGLVTDFISGTIPDKENFPKRNRIIAGLSDAVVVVEAATGGGALITADIANSYNRDVFAIPGRWGDPFSEGCNALVKANRAALIQSANDLILMMNWSKPTEPKKFRQQELLITLHPDEELLVRVLQENGESGFDLLCLSCGLSPGKAAQALLQLEMRGIIQCVPGKRYAMKD